MRYSIDFKKEKNNLKRLKHHRHSAICTIVTIPTCTPCPSNTYSAGGINPTCTPCPKDRPTTNFKSGQTVNACKPVQPKPCQSGHEVTGDGITIPKECKPCAINHYNNKPSEADVKCEPCKNHLKTKGTGQSKCIREFSEEYVMWKLENIDKIMAEQKEKQNDLSIKNSRLWQKEQIRLQHDKLMQQRKSNDDKKEKESCENELKKGTVIFPAVEISNEVEKIEDTTCIDTNRDELLKSFCSFTSDLDNLFQIQNIDEEAKTFWPNICCKERRDITLEACADSNGKIERTNIIPFALSQGGNYSRHNLYVEVTETIKKEGYLHKGMIDLLNSLKQVDAKHKESAITAVNSFFNEVSLCGPRIIDAPDDKDNRKLCQLFVPYHHTMKRFYSAIEVFFHEPLHMQGAKIAQTSIVPNLDGASNSFIQTNSKIDVKLAATNCACKGTMVISGLKQAGDDCGKHGYGYNWCWTVGNECGPSDSNNWKKCTPAVTIAAQVNKPSETKAPNCACKDTAGGINVGDDCGKHGYGYNWCYTVDDKCGPDDSTNWKKCEIDHAATEMAQNTEEIKTKAAESQSKLTNTGLSKDDVKSMIAEATVSLKSELQTERTLLQNSKIQIAALQSKSASLENKLRSNGPTMENIVEEHINTLKSEINTELTDAVTDDSVKKQLVQRQKHRLGKHKTASIKSIGSIMQLKPKFKSKNETCTGGNDLFGPTELASMKNSHCIGYKHLDLSSREIKNVAIHYLHNELSETMLNNSKYMNTLATALRYDVQDTSCPSKLFEAKDISIQQVNMDTLGNKKEWVAVVNLNTKDTNGYLQSELPYCKARGYLIAAKAQIKAYVDDDGCCDGVKDYNKCKVKDDGKCKQKLIELKDQRDKPYSKDVILTGTNYMVKDTSMMDRRRRRRLLQDGNAGS
jgi:hypothetical protein